MSSLECFAVICWLASTLSESSLNSESSNSLVFKYEPFLVVSMSYPALCSSEMLRPIALRSTVMP